MTACTLAKKHVFDRPRGIAELPMDDCPVHSRFQALTCSNWAAWPVLILAKWTASKNSYPRLYYTSSRDDIITMAYKPQGFVTQDSCLAEIGNTNTNRTCL